MIWETRAATIAVRNPKSLDSFDSAVNPCCTKSTEEPLINAAVSPSSPRSNGRFRQCDLYRLLFEQVVSRCAAAGLVAGRELAVDGSTIMADASHEKKLKGATAPDDLRAGDAVSRPVAEYLAALDAALPVNPDEPAPVEPMYVSPTNPQAALSCKHGPARYAYATIGTPRSNAQPPSAGHTKQIGTRSAIAD